MSPSASSILALETSTLKQYELTAFIDTIKDLNYPEIISEAESEANAVDGVLYPGRGRTGLPQSHRYLAVNYRRELGRFLFFMRYGRKPHGVEEHELAAYRRVCKALIQKGQLKLGQYDIFNDKKYGTTEFSSEEIFKFVLEAIHLTFSPILNPRRYLRFARKLIKQKSPLVPGKRPRLKYNR